MSWKVNPPFMASLLIPLLGGLICRVLFKKFVSNGILFPGSMVAWRMGELSSNVIRFHFSRSCHADFISFPFFRVIVSLTGKYPSFLMKTASFLYRVGFLPIGIERIDWTAWSRRSGVRI